MNSNNKYTKDHRERQIFAVVMTIILAGIILFGILDLCGVFAKPVQPDVEIPIANYSVGWQQTYYPGGWS